MLEPTAFGQWQPFMLLTGTGGEDSDPVDWTRLPLELLDTNTPPSDPYDLHFSIPGITPFEPTSGGVFTQLQCERTLMVQAWLTADMADTSRPNDSWIEWQFAGTGAANTRAYPKRWFSKTKHFHQADGTTDQPVPDTIADALEQSVGYLGPIQISTTLILAPGSLISVAADWGGATITDLKWTLLLAYLAHQAGTELTGVAGPK